MTRHKQKEDGMYNQPLALREEDALALGKPLVLMIEDGIDDYGLQRV